MTCPEKPAVYVQKLSFARQTQLLLGYVFSVKPAAWYYNCYVNQIIQDGRYPTSSNVTLGLYTASPYTLTLSTA